MADFTWNFNRSPLPLGLKGEMFELNENSDFADVVKYFNDDFDKANAWWIEHRPEDYNSVRGQQQQSNYVGNSRAAMNMKMNMNSPAAIEANNIAAATRVNHDEQNDRNAQFAKAAEIEDRAKTRNSEIQAIQNKISENNIQIDKLGKAIESIKIKYAKKADYEMTDDTVNENIAIADMLKIGEPGSGARDNTSFWRWREQQNDAKAARAEQRALAEVEKNRLKEKAIGDFNNKMTNFLTNPTAFDSTAAQNQYISNLNTLITEGQNLGADVSALIEKRNTLTGKNAASSTQVQGSPYGGTDKEKVKAEAKAALSSGDLDKINAVLKYDSSLLENDDRIALENKKKKIEKAQAAKRQFKKDFEAAKEWALIACKKEIENAGGFAAWLSSNGDESKLIDFWKSKTGGKN